MKTRQQIISLMDKQLTSLASEQNLNGGFLSETSTNPEHFEQAEKKYSIFPTALILSSIQRLEKNETAKEISKKIVDFLLTQKSDHWSFNYWEKGSPDMESTPYPDDLDDTACILSALFLYDPSLIGGDIVAHFVSLLTFVEAEEGGPYKTWIVPPTADKAWQDVDLAVNSNIGFFLSLQDVSLDSINALIDKALEEKTFSSPYYTYDYSLLYFISRFYQGKKQKEFIDYLLSNQLNDGSWGDSLNTALSLIALSNFGYDLSQLESSIVYLLDNEWKASAFCTELITSETTYYSGSKALTIAFCLEALACYLETNPEGDGQKKSQNDTFTTITTNIIDKVKSSFQFLQPNHKDIVDVVFDRICGIDKHQKIVLLPFLFARALDDSSRADNELLEQLAAANVYGWMAYTICDDFFDGEGRTTELAIANTCLRKLTTIYTTLFKDTKQFLSVFDSIMNTLDQANLWEAEHCHKTMDEQITTLPDFSDQEHLANKSLGHALSPLAILFVNGFATDSKEFQSILRFFKHYIISRQLNDDMHDWEEDLQQGVITSVNAELLALWQKSSQQKAFTMKQACENLSTLQQLFWHELVVIQCERILEHVKQAKNVLTTCDFIKEKDTLLALLKTSEQSAHECLKEREKTIQFLSNFAKTAS